MGQRVDPSGSSARRIVGGCHCRAIHFELLWPDDGKAIAVRNCGCSFCVKHAGAWTSHRTAELIATIEQPGQLSKYAFGTKTADFFVCGRCGVVPFVVSAIEGALYAVVNVNAFDNCENLELTYSATDFDGEGVDSRLDRRKRNWISQVRLRPDKASEQR